MSTNYIAGLVSGVDTTSLIDALVASRSATVRLIEARQAEKTAQLSAWKSFEAILVSLKVESDRLTRSSLWETPHVTTSDEEILQVTADSDAVLDSYEFFVGSLAQAHQVRSVAFDAKTELVGSGTLSITVGSDTTDLTVSSDVSAEDLVELINNSDLAATASLVRSVDAGADSYTIVLTADETGVTNAISVTSTLTGGTDPVFDETVREAQDAVLHFGGEGGLELKSPTNVFEDVIEGVDITVLRSQQTQDPSVTVTVARNTEAVESALADFVDRYNTAVGFVNDQFRYDPEIGTRPVLMGSGTLTMIAGNLRSELFGAIEGLAGDATFRSLAAMGISSTADGTLSIDSDDLHAALEEDFEAVANLFRVNASFDLEGIEFLGAPDGADLAAREVAISVTQAATRATVTGDLFDLGAGGLTIDASNDSFQIAIDGRLSEVLTVAHGTYSDGDSLAGAIQNAIEASDDLGQLGVQVVFEAGSGTTGQLVFTSNRYGSDGTIRLQPGGGGSFLSDLGLSSVSSIEFAGEDLIATVDGVSVTGQGRVITVPDELEDLAGARFQILLPEGDVPATVTATFTEGHARSLTRALATLTDANEGTLARMGTSLRAQIDRYDRDIEVRMEQLEKYRASLQRRYAELESTLGQLQNQSLFLSSQLQAMRSLGGFGLTET